MTERTDSRFFIDYCEDTANRRVRLDDYTGNIDEVSRFLQDRAVEIGAEKLIVKSKREDILPFIEAGYSIEGWLDRYFHGSDAVILAKYLKQARRETKNWEKEENILQAIRLRPAAKEPVPSREINEAADGDSEKLARFYTGIFQSYPVPIADPAYIRESIGRGTIFLFAEEDGNVISAASAEICRKNRNAEMTDCATHPEHRKEGHVQIILRKLEEKLRAEGIFMAYSLSRASSFGMNAAFYRLGYRYRGRLVNNCYFDHELENMNVWVKDLSGCGQDIFPQADI